MKQFSFFGLVVTISMKLVPETV